MGNNAAATIGKRAKLSEKVPALFSFQNCYFFEKANYQRLLQRNEVISRKRCLTPLIFPLIFQ
jgi:hypothetical protein